MPERHFPGFWLACPAKMTYHLEVGPNYMHLIFLFFMVFFALAMVALFRNRHYLVKSTGFCDFVSVAEDQWTWTTRDGRTFENVELSKIEKGVLFLEHSQGSSRVEVVELSSDSSQRLYKTSFWRNHDQFVRAHGNDLEFKEEAQPDPYFSEVEPRHSLVPHV